MPDLSTTNYARKFIFYAQAALPLLQALPPEILWQGLQAKFPSIEESEPDPARAAQAFLRSLGAYEAAALLESEASSPTNQS